MLSPHSLFLFLFNSHPHKEDDDMLAKEKPDAKAFQLTSSQGG